MKHLFLNLALCLGVIGTTMAQNVFPTAAGSYVGIGNANPQWPLFLSHTETIPSGGIKSQIRNNVLYTYTDSTSISRALNGSVEAVGGTRGSEQNSLFFTNVNSLSTGSLMDLQSGVISFIRVRNNGTTTDAYSFRSGLFISGAGKVTNTYKHYFAPSPSFSDGTSGTINRSYGLYIDGQKIAGVTTGFGIFQQSGNDINHFAGKVGIGIISPGSKLDISGNNNDPVLNLRTISTSNPMAMSQFLLSDNVSDYTIGRGYKTTSVINRSLNLNVPEIDSYSTALTQLPKITFTSSGGTNLLGYAESASGNWYLKGNVGVGTQTPDAKLAVNGDVHAKKIRVDLTGWPDYVFNPGYQLPTLTQVEAYVKKNRHLPGIPSAEDVSEKGVDVGAMQAKLLEKVEALTLYLIQQQKEIELLKAKLKSFEQPGK